MFFYIRCNISQMLSDNRSLDYHLFSLSLCITRSTAAIYAVKLYNNPFWIWDIEEHNCEDIKTNGELSNMFITHSGQ
jgi:hypothetical protein